MIKYSVQCSKGHQFDGWFADSATFDRQVKRGLVSCPDCGATKVTKALMAPNVAVSTRRRKSKVDPTPQNPLPTAQPDAATTPTRVGNTTAVPTALPKEMLELMRKVRAEVEANAEYVGPRFAVEARKIHDEDAPSRGIYGEASADEVKALVEDGVECLPLPVLPEDHN